MTFLLLLGLAFGPEPVPAPAAKVVAMVVTWSGAPTWSDGKETRPLKTFDRLRPGDIVTAGPKDTVTVYYPDDGHKEILQAKASIVVGPQRSMTSGQVRVVEYTLKAENQKALREAISAGKIGGTVQRDVRRAEPVVAPLNDAIVVTDRPALAWPADPNAVSYRVTLQTAGSGRTVWAVETKNTRLPFPENETPLKRSLKYTWGVTSILANKNQKTHLKGRSFTVGTPGMAQQAEAWKVLAESADADDQLLAAVGYEHLGLLDELYPLYAKITKSVTNDPKLWAIQANYADKAGLKQEAAEAMARARELGWTGEP